MECGVIRDEFWNPMVKMLVDMGMPEPEDLTNFLITGQLSQTATVDNLLSGVIFLAWRCLYAEIQRSREEEQNLNLGRAYARMVDMVVSRLNAYGEKWRIWVSSHINWHINCIIPEKHTGTNGY